LPLSGQCGLPAGGRLPQILCFAHVTWTSSRSGSAQSKRWGGGLQPPEQATAARVNCTAAPQERAQGIVESLSHPCLFSFQDTETHRQQAPHGCISHHTKRSPERAPSTTTRGPRGSFFLPEPRELVALAAASPHIYTTLLVVPRASTRYSGPPPEGSGRVSVDTAPALHVEPRRPVPVGQGEGP